MNDERGIATVSSNRIEENLSNIIEDSPNSIVKNNFNDTIEANSFISMKDIFSNNDEVVLNNVIEESSTNAIEPNFINAIKPIFQHQTDEQLSDVTETKVKSSLDANLKETVETFPYDSTKDHSNTLINDTEEQILLNNDNVVINNKEAKIGLQEGISTNVKNQSYSNKQILRNLTSPSDFSHWSLNNSKEQVNTEQLYKSEDLNEHKIKNPQLNLIEGTNYVDTKTLLSLQNVTIQGHDQLQLDAINITSKSHIEPDMKSSTKEVTDSHDQLIISTSLSKEGPDNKEISIQVEFKETVIKTAEFLQNDVKEQHGNVTVYSEADLEVESKDKKTYQGIEKDDLNNITITNSSITINVGAPEITKEDKNESQYSSEDLKGLKKILYWNDVSICRQLSMPLTFLDK